MKIDPKYQKILYKKAAQAAFLYERKIGLTRTVAPDERQLADWERCVCARNDASYFDVRLSLSGMNRADALSLTGEQAFTDTVPDWAAAFHDMMALLPFTQTVPDADEIYNRTQQHIGKGNFSRNMLPFLSYGNCFLPNTADYLMQNAYIDLQAGLLSELTQICSSVYKTERQKWLLDNHPATIFFGAGVHNDEFSDMLRNGGWAEILLKYPVLTRQIHMLCVQCAENTAFMLQKFAESREKLEESGLLAPNAGLIASLDVNVGDRHNGGRQVIIFTFENGSKLVYKPRTLLIDEAFTQFLSWLRSSGYDHSIKTPRVVYGEDYGFVEFIENKSLTDESGFARYYARMGELAALLYIFGGNDFHHENVIAVGEYPALVDTETLILHKVRLFDESNTSGQTMIYDLLTDSVVRTGLFPHWIKGAEKGALKNISALYADDEQGNTPHLHGEKRSVEGYEDAFETGFTKLYRHLMAHKEELASDKTPLLLFAKARFRFLTRQSQVYADVLQNMNTAAYLTDGLMYSMQAERLSPAFLLSAKGETLKNVWGLYESEYKALIRYDIPLFFGDADSLLVKCEPEQDGFPYFMQTAIERAKNLCSRLSEEDLKTQTELIEAALGLVQTDSHGSKTAAALPDKCEMMSATQMLDEAMGIYEKIMSSSIGSESPTWLVAQENPAGGMSLSGMSGGFYEGKIGLCVFFAALYRATGDERVRRDATLLLQNLSDGFEVVGTRGDLSRLPIGLALGLGGFIRGFEITSRYLGDDSFHKNIGNLTVTDDMIANDAGLDVISGTAGLSIAAYYMQDARLLTACAEHIRKKQDKTLGGWAVNNMPALAGLGHGASGMALAMLRGYEMNGNPDLLEGAKQAIAFENTLYDEAFHNWRDMRDGKKTKPVFMQGWCSGAPGVGLARLAGLSVLDNIDIRRDIENALTQARQLHAVSDHYCCGQASRVDVLLEAAIRLEQPALLDEARLLMSRVVARSRSESGYTFNSRRIGMNPSPALFQGLAGVGYALLRCVSPYEIESVLI